MSLKKIAVLPGDGIGPEVMDEAVKVLNKISEKYDIQFSYTYADVGGAGIDNQGEALPQSTIDVCKASDAILFGSVGGPKWEGLDYSVRPERALLGLREKLGLYANLRPIVAFDELLAASPLKKEIIRGIDILILRELTGDVYFGKPRGVSRNEKGMRTGVNTMIYTEEEIRRIAVSAFELARKRKKNLVSVDKANVLETTELWRDVVTEAGRKYPDVALDDKSVRRHSERRGRDADRLHRYAAFGLPGRRPGALRTDSRLRAGYRGEEHRQSAGDDFVGRDDASAFAGAAKRSGAYRKSRHRRFARRTAHEGYLFTGIKTRRHAGDGRRGGRKIERISRLTLLRRNTRVGRKRKNIDCGR